MTKPHLTLFPGWGLDSDALEPLLEHLSQELHVELIALPDFSQPDWLTHIHQRIPNGSWLAGWSLGGMLAMQLASLYPQHYAGMISLGSNARFTAKSSWPHAMPALTFSAFKQAVKLCPNTALKQFTRLCSQGDTEAAALARHLQQQQTEPLNSPLAQAGLQHLAQLDNRAAMADYSGAQLHLLAEQDALVPKAVQHDLRQLTPQAQVEVMPGSHAFVFSQAAAVAARMLKFIRENTHA